MGADGMPAGVPGWVRRQRLMPQHIHKRRPRAAPLARWMRNRLRRNKRQCCRCDAMPFPHRRGSSGAVKIGRRSITVTCVP
jgi:hypothetical protein